MVARAVLTVECALVINRGAPVRGPEPWPPITVSGHTGPIFKGESAAQGHQATGRVKSVQRQT